MALLTQYFLFHILVWCIINPYGIRWGLIRYSRGSTETEGNGDSHSLTNWNKIQREPQFSGILDYYLIKTPQPILA